MLQDLFNEKFREMKSNYNYSRDDLTPRNTERSVFRSVFPLKFIAMIIALMGVPENPSYAPVSGHLYSVSRVSGHLYEVASVSAYRRLTVYTR